VKVKRNKEIKVNMCWELDDEKKCVTLTKDQAYATREWVESKGGCVWWFTAIEN
jgi:hypothetical protein